MAGPSILMEPGSASVNLSLAGAWARAALARLDIARSATGTVTLETFEAFGAAMSTVLAFYLATEHACEVGVRAAWIESWPAEAGTPLDLHGLQERAEPFRDFYMHFEDKAHRPSPEHEAAAKAQWKADGPARRRPYGWVSLAFGFEPEGAFLLAPTGKAGTRRLTTRLGWDEVGRASTAIAAWVTDLLSRWTGCRGGLGTLDPGPPDPGAAVI
jgi:hypothetical protein